MPETELASEELRFLADRAQSLGKLIDHPSWQTLREELTRVREMYIDRLSRRMIHGGISAAPVDQRELDYQRGFFAGAEWILSNPEKAGSSLEQALKRRTNE